ncbi:hypothetical protein DTW90_12070 [Neorhizobium sp. P12A]|nr:hypothetical protein DTW90_12070 [Neorhizobium sp. P12A]
MIPFLDIDPAYPTVLPPGLALVIVFASNLVIPCIALFISRRMKSLTWLPHFIAFLWVLCSVVIFSVVGMPTMHDEETGGPADGLIGVPILLEAFFAVLVYLCAWIIRTVKWCMFIAGRVHRQA